MEAGAVRETLAASGGGAVNGPGTAGGVQFAVEQDAPAVIGRLRYDQRRLSFDFRPDEPEVALRERDAAELAFGSLFIQLERERSRDGHGLLGVWGYHPDAGWLNGSLGSPAAVSARLRATLSSPPLGVSLRLVRTGDLTTIQDPRTGWIRAGRTGVATGTQIVEFATGCLAELSSGNLVALWLHPEVAP
jgi:hypothetical protein